MKATRVIAINKGIVAISLFKKKIRKPIFEN
jgi:hypothetical protein